MQHEDVGLLLKVLEQALDEELLQRFTFGDERVDALLLDFPAEPVNENRHLDDVVLGNKRIGFAVDGMSHLSVVFDEAVHLLDGKLVKVVE